MQDAVLPGAMGRYFPRAYAVSATKVLGKNPSPQLNAAPVAVFLRPQKTGSNIAAQRVVPENGAAASQKMMYVNTHVRIVEAGTNQPA